MGLKSAAALFVVCFALPAMAITVDLKTPAPSAPLVFRIDPGKFEIQIANAVPGAKYDIVEEAETIEIAGLGDAPATPAPCSEAPGRAKAALRGKGTEADVAKAGEATAVTQCTAAEQTAIKAEIAKLTTKVIGTNYNLTPAGEITKTLKRGDTKWLMVVRQQGQPDPAPAPPDNLTRLRELTKQPSLTVIQCSYKDEKCLTDALYVNADHSRRFSSPTCRRAGASMSLRPPASTFNAESIATRRRISISLPTSSACRCTSNAAGSVCSAAGPPP